MPDVLREQMDSATTLMLAVIILAVLAAVIFLLDHLLRK